MSLMTRRSAVEYSDDRFTEVVPDLLPALKGVGSLWAVHWFGGNGG